MSTPSKRLPKPVGLTIVLVVVLALIAGIGYGGKRIYSSFAGTPDYTGAGSGSVIVQVHPGDGALDIAVTLKADGVVKSTKAYTKASNANARSRSIQPGYYALHMKMAAVQALDLLLDKASRRGRVTIPEGFTTAQVVARISKSAGIATTSLEQALGNPAVLGLPSYAGNKPEGFLFPATYDVAPASDAVDALAQMTEKFSEEAASVDLVNGAKALGLTPYQVVIIASIAQAETPLPADMPKVARIVLNRLKDGMKLQLDSTLNYVLPQRKGRLTLDDISNPSPFNTYNHTGLPPTPVDSPGLDALNAALHPATGDYLYFVTIDKQGHSLFTSDYQAFVDAKAKAQRDGVY